MFNKAFLIVGALSIVLLSCTDFDRKAQLSQIEKMSQTIDSLQNQLESNKIDTLAGLRTAVLNLELRIRDNYTADTISIELGKKMAQFQTIKRFFVTENEEEEGERKENESLNSQSLGASYLLVKNGLQEEHKTLELLKSDIENGNGQRDKYEDYIQFEQNKVKQLTILLEDYKNHKDNVLKMFFEVYDDLNSFVEKLIKKKSLKKVKK